MEQSAPRMSSLSDASFSFQIRNDTAVGMYEEDNFVKDLPEPLVYV